MINSVIRFFKSADFYKGFVLLIAMLIVLMISASFGFFSLGLSIVMGVFISAPADVQGSLRHRIIGIFAATLLAIFVTLIIGLASNSLWWLIPVLGALVFFISFISVFGFRASLVSFSGLLAIILSFAHPQSGADILLHAALIGVGGLWYLLFSHLAYLLIHKKQTEQLMAECMALTARYLKIRGELALEQEDISESQQKLFELQTEINAKHETLREILLSSRRNAGQSNFARRQVLIFIELIDILELAIANRTNFQKIREIFNKRQPKIRPFINLTFEMANQLDHLARAIGDKKPLVVNNTIDLLLKQAEQRITNHMEEGMLSEKHEEMIMLQSIYDYFAKQAQKIDVIQKVMKNLFEKDQIRLRPKDSSKFVTHQDYDWKTFTENLNFKSPIFKHSLRLTTTVLVGFALGVIFSVQNSYWILLTIIVIMRPGYSLTKQRSKHRTYGTLLGGAVAVGVVLIIQNQYVYAVLCIITFMMAFALVQKNYKTSAMFITLSVVFLYALLEPDVLNVIQFRVLDTLTGAALAVIANAFLWPAWEFLNIHTFIGETIHANRLYLKEIDNYYHHKNNTDPSYKLSRKNAFLAIGNLNAAFQRMTQEPKSRQKDLTKIYEIVVLNHTFLSLAASIGTYIRHHKTTAASQHFESYVASIGNNLKVAFDVVSKNETSVDQPTENIVEARKYMDTKYRMLVEQYTRKTAHGGDGRSDMPSDLQEVKLMSEQLKWLYAISENMKHVVRQIY